MSERQTLYRINWSLHKQGKHACTECLTVLAWTAENFYPTDSRKKYLSSACKACRRKKSQAQPLRPYGERKRQSFARTLSQ